MTPRVTICLTGDGTLEILLNEAGRDLLMNQLRKLDRQWDHFHLDHYSHPDIADATDIALSGKPYRQDDSVLKNAKILLRSDDWDREYFPHVFENTEVTEISTEPDGS